jgi:branched-chain amino acid aminotransferase
MSAPRTFDDRDGFIWWNGQLVPWRDAKPHVLSHGLHYASAVFEGERVYNGKVFKLTEHSQRLIESGRILGFEIPYTLDEIDAATNMVVRANNCGDAYVRPIAWRGSEMMGVAAQQTRINLAIATWDWPSYFSPQAKMKGIRLQIADWRRPSPQTSPTRAKATGGYMICTMSKHRAENEGYDDALMYDWRGQVAEATGANIFFAKDGKLHTPTPDCFLNGITRQTVIALARDRQIQVVERAILPEEMAGFDEAFLTGTAAEVTPIAEIGSYRFQPGRICATLMDDFARATRA